MLNRRILRIKAFKAIYSYAENPSMSLKETEALLDISCEATRDMYLFLLSIVGPLVNEASNRMRTAMLKFNPSEEEKHPNTKFLENRITPLLMEDPDFSKLVSKKKLSWEQYDMFLRRLYERMRERQYYKDYLSNKKQSLEEDAKLWSQIFELEFEDDKDLAAILEDLSIYWNDDLGYALSWCCKTMTALSTGEVWHLPALYMSDILARKDYESDKSFIYKVLRTAYANIDKYIEEIANLTPKWNRDRLCATDLAIIVCGMAEASAYPNTPINIIINEYVEISKYYSTPDSSRFVNGLLDKLINKQN